MPLKLIAPRKGKSPNFTVRGTYLGRYVDRSTGTGEKRVALKELRRIKDSIEAGRYGQPKGPTFLSEAVAYIQSGGEATYLPRLMQHFGEMPISDIDQKAIDNAAQELYPNASNATRNRQVYTPVSAILKRAGIVVPLQRPKGALGQTRTDWLWPEQAFALFKAADKIDAEFGVFLRLLTYTGLRLSEALNLRWNDVRLDEGFAYVAETKGGDPRPVFLPLALSRMLRQHLKARTAAAGSARVFRFTKSGRLYNLLKIVSSAGHTESLNFHMLRHTYATWMRRYAGLDVRGLVETGAWKDDQAAGRYAHSVPSEAAKKAALLPVEDEE